MNTSEKIIKVIEQKIYYKRNDTLLNHLKTYFRLDKINFSGQCNGRQFSVWRYSAFTGLFYTVIIGDIQSDNEKLNIVLKTKLNSAGFLLSTLIFLGFFFGFPSFEISSITIKNTLFRLLFALLPLIAIRLGYLWQRQNALKDVQDIIENAYK